MMLLAALIALQTPGVTPKVQRAFRPNQKFVYEVESSVKDSIGVTLLSFKFDLQTPKKFDSVTDGVVMTILLHDMDQTVGSSKMHKKGGFGNATMTYRPNGLPDGIMLDGPIAPFLLPFTCFYLPSEFDSEGKWALPATMIENGLVLQGSGTMKAGTKDRWQSDGTYSLSLKDKKLADITSSSTFSGKDGALLQGSGTFSSQEGSMSFTMRRR